MSIFSLESARVFIMNVRKKAQPTDPDYPSQRQFSEVKRLVGVAAIGLSAMAGWAGPARTAGVPVRTGGKPAMEPRQITPPETAASTNTGESASSRLRGEIAVEPRLLGLPPVVPPQASTNLQARATYAVKKGDTLSALAARFLGDRNRWRDIVAANPGVTPETLKAGQSIVIPEMIPTKNTEPLRLKGKMPESRP
jgi:nucleoid-associated protein YgaU